MHEPTLIPQLLTQLLSEKSPEFGARLKQRLNASLVSRGLGYFDEKAYGYKKFSDFLTKAHGEVVSVERPGVSGDILVSLRYPAVAKSEPAASVGQQPRIRNDIWQAFSNPDPQRKRYLNKTTMLVSHFLQGEASAFKTEIEQNPEQFVEIEPINSQTQIEWMRGFLETIRISLGEKSALEALINESYSSGVNATFSRALGEHGAAWRSFRTSQVVSRMKAWASEHKVQFERLCFSKCQEESSITSKQVDQMELSSRQTAIKLLELLNDDDIARLVIPTLLSTILIKSRL